MAKSDVIDYITIASTGNATDFGDLASGTSGITGCSNSTRGLFAGGDTVAGAGGETALIQYITIATTGNTAAFGDLSAARVEVGACSSTVRAVFAGGDTYLNTIEYVVFSTFGTAVDCGDLTVARSHIAGLSNCHGGL